MLHGPGAFSRSAPAAKSAEPTLVLSRVVGQAAVRQAEACWRPPTTSHPLLCCAGSWDRLLRFQQQVGYMAQGEQRALDKGGKVSALKEPNPQLVVSAAGTVGFQHCLEALLVSKLAHAAPCLPWASNPQRVMNVSPPYVSA